MRRSYSVIRKAQDLKILGGTKPFFKKSDIIIKR